MRNHASVSIQKVFGELLLQSGHELRLVIVRMRRNSQVVEALERKKCECLGMLGSKEISEVLPSFLH